jgi:hypothetical protein
LTNGFLEANNIQKETFGTLKVVPMLCCTAGNGKSTTLLLNVIQRLVGTVEESPRALIIVSDKEKWLRW